MESFFRKVVPWCVLSLTRFIFRDNIVSWLLMSLKISTLSLTLLWYCYRSHILVKFHPNRSTGCRVQLFRFMSTKRWTIMSDVCKCRRVMCLYIRHKWTKIVCFQCTNGLGIALQFICAAHLHSSLVESESRRKTNVVTTQRQIHGSAVVVIFVKTYDCSNRNVHAIPIECLSYREYTQWNTKAHTKCRQTFLWSCCV